MARDWRLRGGDCMPNEKAGRELRLFPSKIFLSACPTVNDVAESGRRPVERLEEEGAEEGDNGEAGAGLGKTKFGRGRGAGLAVRTGC